MKKVLKISVGLLSALLLGCYGAGCYYFQSHYYYGTTIEGRIYGCMAEPETEEEEPAEELEAPEVSAGEDLMEAHQADTMDWEEKQ